MPRRRRPERPPTSEGLPDPPQGAIKKPYHPHPDNVYYLKTRMITSANTETLAYFRTAASTRWSRGSYLVEYVKTRNTPHQHRMIVTNIPFRLGKAAID